MAYIVKIVAGSKSKCSDPILHISLQGSKGAIMGIELDEKRCISHQKECFSCGKVYTLFHACMLPLNRFSF